MRLLQKLSTGLFGVFAITVFAVSFDTTQTLAHDTGKAHDHEKSASIYTYKAQEGDSYSQLARKAIQTYGITEKAKLSQAQIVYAETELTQKAGSPILEIGQKVTIKDSDVKSVVERAKKLDATTLAAWQAYVPYVDFNTDNVGE